MTNKTSIPQFYFPKHTFEELKRNNKNQHNDLLMNQISRVFQKQHGYLTESEFEVVTGLCSLPRYMNLALFRTIDELNDKITLSQFKQSWQTLTQGQDHTHDIDLLMYTIIKKPDTDNITPDDFLPILEDIVLHHPSLQFLENSMTFQERYIETVICRMFYQARCPTGKMSLSAFRKSGISLLLQALTPSMDLYNIPNVFSYTQFYVLYCKLWSLDADHDLFLTEADLCNYNMGTLGRLTIQRIMDTGHIMTFADPIIISDKKLNEPSASLTYFDFIWFLLSEVDKSTPVAIEYWFRCLDIDGDGVLSFFELRKFWQDQELKQQFCGSAQNEGNVQFEDIMRQMNDLVQPQIPGHFFLKDLKKNGYLAERFFDTFINFDRFQVHEAHQEGSVRQQKEYENKLLLEQGFYRPCEPLALTDELGLPVLCNWNDYADIEYHRIVLDESYINSYEDNESCSHSHQSNASVTEEEEEEEQEDFSIRLPYNNIGFGRQIGSQDGHTNNGIICSDSPDNEYVGTPVDQSNKSKDYDMIEHNSKMSLGESSRLTISVDCSHPYEEGGIDAFSPLFNLSDLEDTLEGYDDDDGEDDHGSIEGSGARTPESPIIITPKAQLDQESQKHTTTTSYFDLDNEDSHPKRSLQLNNPIINYVN